ncbi:Ran-binding protein 9 [Fukomys damarensis]|uniref:Ran-binding protein 9 n=1 Tax=Fukomys damarensis TaxID=885580 RepID=A0A091DRU8_FUKDA|nr:Ran-binding protein 9 [Fukomys damarensis]
MTSTVVQIIINNYCDFLSSHCYSVTFSNVLAKAPHGVYPGSSTGRCEILCRPVRLCTLGEQGVLEQILMHSTPQPPKRSVLYASILDSSAASACCILALRDTDLPPLQLLFGPVSPCILLPPRKFPGILDSTSLSPLSLFKSLQHSDMIRVQTQALPLSSGAETLESANMAPYQPGIAGFSFWDTIPYVLLQRSQSKSLSLSPRGEGVDLELLALHHDNRNGGRSLTATMEVNSCVCQDCDIDFRATERTLSRQQQLHSGLRHYKERQTPFQRSKGKCLRSWTPAVAMPRSWLQRNTPCRVEFSTMSATEKAHWLESREQELGVLMDKFGCSVEGLPAKTGFLIPCKIENDTSLKMLNYNESCACEITLQQIMSKIANVKKDMIILEKSEFSALRAENEKIKLELHQLKQQVMDEVIKVRTDTKLDFNLEKSRVKELYSLNERKLLELRTEIVELHAQQDRALTQTDRKIETEVSGLKTMLEAHKLDTIKYLAGHGKTPKDAASVRATHPIPAACGIYYFEVKIVSKGRDGYMGIGLSAQGVNMNRLPGWDKHSYGYHGDDGHSFCSSGTGQPYGPTFTTGDVIGCCVNLINNTCFYTKNGHSLGIAFTDLPPNLYPTVGLQTPGEVVDANFGQHPFVFDIEDYMREWRTKIQAQIDRFPIGDREGEWQTMIQKMVSSYLVHHGYCATAEAFARSTDQTVLEELASIKNRQRIQKLVLAGRMGEAIETTQQLYPSLLERNPNLLFTLKVRQFIEMVNGTDSEVRCLGGRSPKSQDSYPVSPRPFSSPSMSPSHGLNIHNLASGKGSTAHFSGLESCSNGIISNKAHQSYCHSKHQSSNLNVPELNSINMSRSQQVNNFTSNDVDMETDHYSNGVGETSSNGFLNGSSKHDHEMEDCDTEMEIDSSQLRRQLCGGSQAAIERMIHFGRELQAMSEQLRRECGKNTANKKMLKASMFLLAYSDPWNSPVGNQLDPIQREPVCSALNSAILETHNLPKQPPLALAMGQATQCLGLMARSGIGSCAFATVEDYLH